MSADVKRPRVLVVEDEDPLRTVLRRVLGGDHELTEAANGHDALGLIESGEFDLIISDVRMPKMDGFAFHDAVAARRPELAKRIVFLSGTARSDDVPRHLQAVPMMEKPFTPPELRAFVASSLARLGRVTT